MTAASVAGRFDARRPSLRFQLFPQVAPAAQRALFASAEIAPGTEPPCDHPATEQQRRLGAPEVLDDVCVACGAVVDDEAQP